MPGITENSLFLLLLKIYAALFVLGPIILRIQFRFNAKLDPQSVPLESLPADVRGFFATRISAITGLGFELIGYVNVAMTKGTGSYMALFSNPRSLEWADISAAKTSKLMKGYTEFITRCANDEQVDTNTNATAPVLSPQSSHHVFRFPQIQEPFTLYRVHRALVQQTLRGSQPELPPKGQEIAELKRRLERYGRQQSEQGYMYLDASGQFYRLTWKGAVLGAWRSIWPVNLLRSKWMEQQNQTRLRSLGVQQVRPT